MTDATDAVPEPHDAWASLYVRWPRRHDAGQGGLPAGRGRARRRLPSLRAPGCARAAGRARARRPGAPELPPLRGAVGQWGGPNPDNVYLRAGIDPTGDLPGDRRRDRRAPADRLAGRRRHAPRQLRRASASARSTTSSVASRRDARAHGSRPTSTPGNWIATDPAARYLLIRQFHMRLGAGRDRDASPSSASTRVRAVAASTRPGRRWRPRSSVPRDWVERSLEYWCTYVDALARRAPAQRLRPAVDAAGRRSRTSRTAPDGGSSLRTRRCSSRPRFPTPTTGAGPSTRGTGSTRASSPTVRRASTRRRLTSTMTGAFAS